FRNIKPHRKPGLPRQIDERIKAEIRDPAAQQVIEARLCDPETPRRLGLGDTPTPHALLDRDKQIGPHGHIRGLGRRIFQCIPYIRKALTFHRDASARFAATGSQPSLNLVWPSAASSSGRRAAHRRYPLSWRCRAPGRFQPRRGYGFPALPALRSSSASSRLVQSLAEPYATDRRPLSAPSRGNPATAQGSPREIRAASYQPLALYIKTCINRQAKPLTPSPRQVRS